MAAAVRARVRWGLPDVALAWFAGLFASLLALPLAQRGAESSEQPARYLVAALILQNLGIVAALMLISRTKGRGTLAEDFGLVSPLRRLGGTATLGWLAAGAGVSVAAQALLWPIGALADLDEPAQDVSRALENANGIGRFVFALAVVLVAPPVEELLFRGALLRGLQRRWSIPVAVFTSALIFATIHLLGGLSSGYVIPGVLLLGLVSGYQAAKSGNLARSILLHTGFNLLSAVGLLLS